MYVVCSCRMCFMSHCILQNHHQSLRREVLHPVHAFTTSATFKLQRTTRDNDYDFDRVEGKCIYIPFHRISVSLFSFLPLDLCSSTIFYFPHLVNFTENWYSLWIEFLSHHQHVTCSPSLSWQSCFTLWQTIMSHKGIHNVKPIKAWIYLINLPFTWWLTLNNNTRVRRPCSIVERLIRKMMYDVQEATFDEIKLTCRTDKKLIRKKLSLEVRFSLWHLPLNLPRVVQCQ